MFWPKRLLFVINKYVCNVTAPTLYILLYTSTTATTATSYY